MSQDMQQQQWTWRVLFLIRPRSLQGQHDFPRHIFFGVPFAPCPLASPTAAAELSSSWFHVHG